CPAIVVVKIVTPAQSGQLASELQKKPGSVVDDDLDQIGVHCCSFARVEMDLLAWWPHTRPAGGAGARMGPQRPVSLTTPRPLAAMRAVMNKAASLTSQLARKQSTARFFSGVVSDRPSSSSMQRR